MKRNRLRKLFAPPQFDAPSVYAVKQVHYILLFGIIATCAYFVLQLLLAPPAMEIRFIGGAFCLIELLLFGLLRRGHVWFVTICLLLAAYVGLMTVLYFNGGLQNMALFAAPLLLIISSLFLGSTASSLFGLLLLAGYLALFSAEHMGILPNSAPVPTSVDSLLILMVTTVLMALYLSLGNRQIAHNVKRVEQQARSLELTHELSAKISSSLELKTQEVSTLNEYLQTTQRQLIESEKMAALGSLVAGVAHEINTPLGVGITAASTLAIETEQMRNEYIKGGLKRSGLEEYLDTATKSSQMITANLQRAAQLVQSFKQVAVDQTSMEQRLFSVKKYFTEIMLSLEPTIKRYHHTVELSGDDTVRLNSFPGELAQIITNLVMNSIMHGYEEGVSGHLQLLFEVDNDSLYIEYKDNGRGIAPDNLNKIFEPFFTTARHRGGTGLGLHIVYNLITQNMKGTIQCESQVGQGVRFIIKLPLALESADSLLETTEFEAMIKGTA